MYPLKFKPVEKRLLWGTEQWVVSGVGGNESVVSNGTLRSDNLAELAEVYMGDLLGEEVFEQFGGEFPLLVKFIDAREKLSVQVHPSDELACQRHRSRGKTEMWYVIAAEPGAVIYAGFKRQVTPSEYLEAVQQGVLADLLMCYPVKAGDAYFIPAGTVHAIGAGVRIAEIQQASDITYRIDDWGRVDGDGKPRELHTREALDAINFAPQPNAVITAVGEAVTLVATPWFTVNQITLAGRRERNYEPLDSFVILVCVAGSCTILYEGGVQPLASREAILVPASVGAVTLNGTATILEIYV